MVVELRLEPGSFGSVWPIHPAPIRGGDISGKKWTMRFAPRLPLAFMSCADPTLRGPTAGYRQTMERYLDMLSWEGGGHYELNPLHAEAEHILWDWTGKRPRAQITLLAEQRLPFSIRAFRADSEPSTSPVGHHPAMRYFRCAQVATNPVAAFQNLYLAFENLAEEHEPFREDDSESSWLKRVAHTVIVPRASDNDKVASQTSYAKKFHGVVYEGVRCSTFHAKGSKKPVAPHDEREPQVRRAYGLLLPHVIELLGKATRRPAGQRIPMHTEMDKSGEVLVALEEFGFVAPPETKFPPLLYEVKAWSEGKGGLGTWCVSTRLEPDQLSKVAAIRWRLGTLGLRHAFQVFPQCNEPLDLEIRLVSRVRFDGLLQEPGSPVDYIANLRSASALRHSRIAMGSS